MADRQIIVHTAQHWYDAAKASALDGDHVQAFMHLMNAFNHTENALAALLGATTMNDRPPHSGRTPMTLAEMRDRLAALHSPALPAA